MEQVAPSSPPLFNSALEAGIRAVTLLEAVRPLALDLSEMVILDHVVVHSGDLGGPPSLHPAVPGRKGELLVRRRLIEESLSLMRRFHLVAVCESNDGLAYRATDEAAGYVELLESDYSVRLRSSAFWISDQISQRGKTAFLSDIRSRLDDWATAFIGPDLLRTSRQ